LTSHRICYVDKVRPRQSSVALELKEVERYEISVGTGETLVVWPLWPAALVLANLLTSLQSGFLTSSPKIKLIPKPKRSTAHRASPVPSTGRASPAATSSPRLPPPDLHPVTAATWVCPICSLSNPVPSNFDPTTARDSTPLPPCLACGIKPTLAHILKASISNAAQRTPGGAIGSPLPIRPSPLSGLPGESHENVRSCATEPSSPLPTNPDTDATFHCPRCTFGNHPSLMACEICGAPLISQDIPASTLAQPRTDSPGPILPSGPSVVDTAEVVKVSFRGGGGGDKIFYERLKGAMIQRKWLLQGALQLPKNSRQGDENATSNSSSGTGFRANKAAGIAALEQRGLDMRKNNEVIIGDAFEDLESLMASAKEVVALAEQFAHQVNGSGGSAAVEATALANQLGLVTTKDIVGSGGSESLYLSELARNLAEFLTDDARGVLRKAGGIISLVDLWAMFNRARGGVELVSPLDFEKATRLWETLGLPVRLRRFRSGVTVVQSKDRTDETTVKAMVAWLKDLHEFPPEREVPWDWHQFGIGVTAQDAGERFGWSIGVAEEELEMAEERGAVCREEGIEGLRFWLNYIDTGDVAPPPSQAELQDRELMRILKGAGFI
jgi:ESCRT-II complex subunit VPS36